MLILSFKVQEKKSSTVDARLCISATNQKFISSTVSCFEERVETAAEKIYFNEEQESKSPISNTGFKQSSSSYKPSSEEQGSDSFKLSDSEDSILN